MLRATPAGGYRFASLRLIAALAALMLLAAACGEEAAPEGGGGTPTGGAVVGRCGDPERLGASLNFYNWADYIDEKVLEMFEEECGVRVTMDTYTSNEEMLAKIQAGNSGYSLVIPTDYTVKIMIEQGLARPLDMENIPNRANLDPKQLGQYYDPENEFSLPYQYSTTGMAYNATAFDEPPTSWAVLFDQNEHCGESSLLDDQYETTGAALVYLGYSWNETSDEAHEKAIDLLLDAKECVSAFDSANFIGNLASGEVVVAEAWGFAAGIARLDNPDVEYVIPEEGGILWQDNFVIPADAPDPYTAEVFINYMLEPDIGALITEFTFGFTPNLKVEPLLSDDYHEIITDGGIVVDDAVRERLEPSIRPDPRRYSDTYTAVTAG
jgi:spermidine/putrescine transport system substrate-binding protein